jgi:hypothetical protein
VPEQQPKGISKEEMEEIVRSNPNKDPLPGKLSLPTYSGSIEEAEEKRFPWLRERRRRRRRG